MESSPGLFKDPVAGCQLIIKLFLQSDIFRMLSQLVQRKLRVLDQKVEISDIQTPTVMTLSAIFSTLLS